jgi:hypothetical protein
VIVEIPFRVTPDGGEPYEVTAGTRDVLVWEKTTPGAVASGLAEQQSLVDMYKIAWIASRRHGLFDGTLQQFEQNCDLDDGKDEPNVDPTNPAASAGS